MKTIYDYQLKKLNPEERVIFAFIVLLLLIFSILANIGTLFVNVKRKIRPLSRACLLSLACSDLLTALSTGVTYLTQFSTEFFQIWHLGDIMCGLIPFLQTTGILVNSMTLVGIAIDRYMAVMRVVMGTWAPGNFFSGTCITLIWGLSAGIASPMISSFTTYDVFIILTHTNNSSILHGLLSVKMCASDKNDNAYYYVIIFAIVFLPSVCVFLWLNGVIARAIWLRRRDIRTLQYKISTKDEQITKKTTVTISDSPPSQKPHEGIHGKPQGKPPQQSPQDKLQQNQTQKKSQQIPQERYQKKFQQGQEQSTPSRITVQRQKTIREIRQLRMIYVILLLMFVFLLCRLPTWTYLIMKLHGNYVERIHWILHFSFGILSLFNCVLNPLLYTFLSGTILWTLAIKNKFKKCFTWRRCFRKQVDNKLSSSNSGRQEIYTILQKNN